MGFEKTPLNPHGMAGMPGEICTVSWTSTPRLVIITITLQCGCDASSEIPRDALGEAATEGARALTAIFMITVSSLMVSLREDHGPVFLLLCAMHIASLTEIMLPAWVRHCAALYDLPALIDELPSGV